MKWFSLAFLLLVFLYEGRAATIDVSWSKAATIDNERPIIGVLSQEMSYYLDSIYPGKYSSYIAASYVKLIEGSGARVVPIWIGKEKAYYEDIMGKINGVLFPGGATWFNQSGGYADAGEHIYNIAKDLNDDGDYFPLWGTCLGFELLSYLSDNRNDHRAVCSSERETLNLEFKNDFQTSKMFKGAPSDVVSILSNEKVTSNFHSFCITEDILSKFSNDWRVLSLNDDVNGLKFVSSMESQNYPFYGVQFHPEKNIYEWVRNRNISHSASAIKANRYFGDFLVAQARMSQHAFTDVDEENSKVIYNYNLEYSGIKGSAYEQIYVFTGNEDSTKLMKTWRTEPDESEPHA